VQEHVVLRLELERLLQRLDGLLRVVLFLDPDVADLVQHLEALFAVVHVVEDLPLVGGRPACSRLAS
jgi:hypothetical protein